MPISPTEKYPAEAADVRFPWEKCPTCYCAGYCKKSDLRGISLRVAQAVLDFAKTPEGAEQSFTISVQSEGESAARFFEVACVYQSPADVLCAPLVLRDGLLEYEFGEDLGVVRLFEWLRRLPAARAEILQKQLVNMSPPRYRPGATVVEVEGPIVEGPPVTKRRRCARVAVLESGDEDETDESSSGDDETDGSSDSGISLAASDESDVETFFKLSREAGQRLFDLSIPLVDESRYAVTVDRAAGYLRAAFRGRGLEGGEVARAHRQIAEALGSQAPAERAKWPRLFLGKTRSASLGLHGDQECVSIIQKWANWHRAWIYRLRPAVVPGGGMVDLPPCCLPGDIMEEIKDPSIPDEDVADDPSGGEDLAEESVSGGVREPRGDSGDSAASGSSSVSDTSSTSE